MNFTILRYEAVGSTNDEALRQARLGAAEGLCISAGQQTAGRGRHGRVWLSPADSGLYFSFILRPVVEMRFLPLITLMTAIAVHDTTEELYQVDCDIKWANDIHINGRKVCGILAETCETKLGLAVIVGIGINLKESSFPPELKETATSIESAANQPADLSVILETLTKKLAIQYNIFQGPDGAEKIRQSWIQKSSYAFGKAVRVTLDQESIIGTTRGIETDGALRVETKNGEIKIVRAGEVERLRQIET